MKKNLILVCFSILLALPNLAVSDCTDLGRVTSWYVQDENTMIAYIQNTPAAKIVLEDCAVSASSNIRLLKSYVCDEDKIIVDGEECAIMTLTSASGGSL